MKPSEMDLATINAFKSKLMGSKTLAFLLSTSGEDHPTGTILFDEIGGADFLRYDIGIIHVIPKVQGAFTEGLCLPSTTEELWINPWEGSSAIATKWVNEDLIEIKQYTRDPVTGYLTTLDDGYLSNFPFYFSIFDSLQAYELVQSTLPVSRPKSTPQGFNIERGTPNSMYYISFGFNCELEADFEDSLSVYNPRTSQNLVIIGAAIMSENPAWEGCLELTVQGTTSFQDIGIEVTFDGSKTMTFRNGSTCDAFVKVVDLIM